MKKFLLFATLILCVPTLKSQNFSKHNAIKSITNIIDTNKVEIWVCDTTILPESHIYTSIGDSIKSPRFLSWCVFVNDSPLANWGHSCTYYFVGANTDSISTVIHQFPPKLDIFSAIKVTTYDNAFESPIIKQNYAKDISNFNPKDINNSQKFAVIINGGVDKNMNHIRYWNDCSFIY